MVGGDYVDRNYRAAAEEGRIVQIAVLHGAKATADVSLIMRKRLVHTGSTLRPRPVHFKATIAAELEARVWPLLESRAGLRLQGTQHVFAGFEHEVVVPFLRCHDARSARHSRNRIRPRRIQLLTVPSGASSRCESS